ncbi:hypothetical protein T4E_3116 [Trichinella pseudospiralis]|uniref:Uncharacterized protein n=1 Tax=Trichinella pseudospiralis TaxID=6337 RepID=A0A0V0XBQ1_TRIPS|nr:hypothetical protein T4E_3116 [Trichinella pseudospiralis]
MPFLLSIPGKRISLDFMGIECMGKQQYCLFVQKEIPKRFNEERLCFSMNTAFFMQLISIKNVFVSISLT